MDPLRVIIVAVGGQGNLLASRVLSEAALLADIPIRMSEIHGMAQRGGVVESALVFGDAESPIISDGQADILVGFEPAETLRALCKCHSQTVVVTNMTPVQPYTVAIGKSIYPNPVKVVALLKAKTRQVVAVDAAALAREAGSELAVNMVLLGSLVATRALPLTAEQVLQAMRQTVKPAFLELNQKAFDLGFAAAQFDS